MKSIITLLLMIGLAVAGVKYFLFDEMWDKHKVKNEQVHTVIDDAIIPKS